MAFVVGQISINGNDVAEVAAGGEVARCAMAGEENEDAVFTLDEVGVAKLVSEKRQNVFSGRVLVEQHENVIGLECIFLQQEITDALRIIGRIAQLRPSLIIVDADDGGPTVSIWRNDGGRSRLRRVSAARCVGSECAAIPANELITVLLEHIDDLGQGFEGDLVDVVKKDDSVIILFGLLDNALGNRIGHGISPIFGINIPEDRLEVVGLHFGENGVVNLTSTAVEVISCKKPGSF